MIRCFLRDKAPEGEEVYSIDWTAYLGQDTLTDAPVSDILEGTIVVDTLSNPDNKHSRFFVRGGVRGEVGKAMIKVTTAGGQTLEAEIIIGIR